MDFNLVTSLQRSSSSELVLTAAIDGDDIATSMILSASRAMSSRFPGLDLDSK